MPKLLTERQQHDYADNGILFPIPVLSAREAAEFLAAANDLEDRLGGKPKPVELAQMHLHFQWAYDLATHPRVVDAVEDVLGANVVAWATGLFPKHPHDSSYISWHQDGTYWNLDSAEVVTAWIALSNSTSQNGCMRVVAGSQNMDIQPHTDTYADQNLLSRGQEIAVDVSEDQATDVVLRAGEMSLHHVRIIHGSNANRSDEKRVGFTIRYVTPRVSQSGRTPQALLVRGTDDYGHFDFTGAPPKQSIDAAVTAMKESAREQLASLMDE